MVYPVLTNYTCLILCRIVGEMDDQNLVYVMESRSSNNKLQDHNPQLQDGGTITIGTIVMKISSLPIKNLMEQYNQMSETRFPVIVMKYPIKLRYVELNMDMTGNKSQAFVLNSCNIKIILSTPE